MNRRTQGFLLSEAVISLTKYKVVESLSLSMLESNVDTHSISPETADYEFTYS